MFLVSENQQNLASEKEDGNVDNFQFTMDDINGHPGFATAIFVSWDAVADYLDYFEEYGIQPSDREANPEFTRIAYIEAQNWAELHQHLRGRSPSPDIIMAKENEIMNSLQDHWSSCNIALEKFDFDKYVSDANTWSHNGAKRPELFGHPPDPGKALETFTTDLGINFTVYRPFMIPYLESYYFLYNTLPEWDYEELEPSDIIETLFTIQAMLGNDIDISLENWAGLWKFEDDLTTQFKD